jgi:tol-pal system beta propeller repeat protein TolB
MNLRIAVAVLSAVLWTVPTYAGSQQTAAVSAPARPSVLVLPVRNDPHDSIRIIMTRNLDYGSQLDVLERDMNLIRPLVAGANPPILAPDSIGQLGARFVLLAERVADSIRVTVFDSLSRGPGRTRSYPVPAVQYRAGIVHDSLTRLFAAREAAARSRLTQLGAIYDSLMRASRGRQPRSIAERERVAAQRDSAFLAIAAEAPRLHAAITRLPVERDSALAAHVGTAVTVYDSSAYVQRMALHEMSDAVQHWLTGVRGAAASRIAFVRGGRLHVIDSDGANERQLTRSGRALSPAWHPSGRWIVFSDITDSGTQIAEVEVGTGDVRFLTATPRGYNITPAYSPDGTRIVFAASGTGGSHLVAFDRATGRLTSLGTRTRNASSPSFSPDGNRMAVVMPRAWSGSGSSARMTPQIFVVSIRDTKVDQLTPTTFGVRSYRTSPEWSPDGRYVAYTQQGGGFQIWLLDLQTRRARQLTSGADHDDATWSPDSRHLLVTAGRDDTKFLVIDVETGRTREVKTRSGARLPAWSPRWTTGHPVVRPGDRYAASED